MSLEINQTTVNMVYQAQPAEPPSPPLCAVVWNGALKTVYFEGVYYVGMDSRRPENPYAFSAKAELPGDFHSQSDAKFTLYVPTKSLSVPNGRVLLESLALWVQELAARLALEKQFTDCTFWNFCCCCCFCGQDCCSDEQTQAAEKVTRMIKEGELILRLTESDNERIENILRSITTHKST